MAAPTFNLLLDAMTGASAPPAPWLGALREQARTLFASSGLPTRHVESWKYSDLARALEINVESPVPTDPAPLLPGAHAVLFENGALNEAKSNLSAFGATSLRAVLADPAANLAGEIGRVNPQADHALLNINTALMEDGIVVRAPANTSISAPIHVMYDWRGEAARAPEGGHLRLLIVLEEGASATLVESHAGSPGFSTIVTEVRLARNARLTHVRLEQLGAGARQSAVTLGELDAAAAYKGFYLSEGARFSRHEALLRIGENASAELDGVYLTGDGRHCDNTTVFTHDGLNASSRQVFRGVLAGASRAAYQGCIQVRPDAQGADARQMSRALLLSRDAEVATKPELEILADDVKCSHGATAGELDRAALFFLRARGIPETEAKALLVEAFLGEILDEIGDETLRSRAADAVSSWLNTHAREISHAQ
ncbi:Fe-S cluster assembly protein SufD [Methylocapsa palsarum]|uniref:Fe-S cluster assembly protein SufD n=1 Tax=Methylocapsa palsarum TaxID=1612308 RepID=A0A1I3W1T1_9HYPH|nr:Fe-S cluster assembly protein SufD [Methylocapsa palsarum]SFK01594.1 Fe-S cluster assembly protein SufD [Methylocapsa palsarum]